MSVTATSRQDGWSSPVEPGIVGPDRNRIRLTDGLATLLNTSEPTHMTPTQPWGDQPSPYIEIGGDEKVRQLAEAFYDRIEDDSPTLRAMLPKNTKKTRQRFYMYITGWMGGPPLYEMKWGHPQLRIRHLPFAIGAFEADEWMRCMRAAMDDVDVAEPLRKFLDTG